MSPKPVATDPAARDAALRIARERGAATAERETGIPAATIRSWRSREARAASSAPEKTPSTPPARTGDTAVDELALAAHETYVVAIEARDFARRAMQRGRTTGAKDLTDAMRVLLDQSGKIQAAAERISERRAELSQEQLALVTEILRVTFRALELPFEPRSPFAALVASVVRSSGGDAILADPAAVGAAKRALRDVIERELLADGWRPPEVLSLPAGEEVGDDEPDGEEDGDVEEIDAEVVDEPPRAAAPAVDSLQREIDAAWANADDDTRGAYLARWREPEAKRAHYSDLQREGGPSRFGGGRTSIAAHLRQTAGGVR